MTRPDRTSAEPHTPPLDPHDESLARHVRPPDWVNPTPAGRYNLVVIGGGIAGLAAAAGAAALGARVALVESDRLGGECLHAGSVPSKTLIRCARAAAAVRDAGRFGVRVPDGVFVDFPAVMERVRRVRAALSPRGSVERFHDLGVDVFLGRARFVDRGAVRVDDRVLRFSRACIATGARPAAPPIDGLEDVGYLTSETAFSLTARPPRLAVIGAGSTGCELAQAFARLGAEVVLLEARDRILPTDDPEAADRVAASMRRDGVAIRCGVPVIAARHEGGERQLRLDDGGEVRTDEVLVCVGRQPAVEGLDLEAAGVTVDPVRGIAVDDRLRTSNHDIYAAGDVCTDRRFSHAAEAMARVVVHNALYLPTARMTMLALPWCTYTDPEVAHVGLHPSEADDRGIEVETWRTDLFEVARAVIDGADEGFLKIHVAAGRDEILGATLVAPHAGEMISELTLAITGGLGLTTLARTLHPYPTQAEAIKRAADAYARSRLTPLLERVSNKIMAWRR